MDSVFQGDKKKEIARYFERPSRTTVVQPFLTIDDIKGSLEEGRQSQNLCTWVGSAVGSGGKTRGEKTFISAITKMIPGWSGASLAQCHRISRWLQNMLELGIGVWLEVRGGQTNIKRNP